MTINDHDLPRIRDLRVAQAFVELGGARPNTRPDHDEQAPSENDHRLWSRLADLCVELLDLDAAAVFLLDDSHTLQMIVDTSARAHPVRRARAAGSGRRRLPATRNEDLHSHKAISARHPGWTPASGEPDPSDLRALVLHEQGSTLGTLDLLRRGRGPLPPDDIALAQALADVTAATATYRRSLRRSEAVNQQLQTALDSRIVLEQAKGILSQSHSIGLDAAFELMRGYARPRNLLLRDVARRVIADGGTFMIDRNLTA